MEPFIKKEMRRFSSLIVFWLILSACNAVNETVVTHTFPKTILAYLEPDETRVEYKNGHMVWNEWDDIAFYGYDSFSETGVYQGWLQNTEEGGNIASFLLNMQPETYDVQISHYYAVYPFDASKALLADGIVNLDLPAVQNYSSGSFGKGANTMVASTSGLNDHTVSFKNTCGYLVVNLFGNDTVSYIRFSGNSGEKISGSATVVINYDRAPVLSLTDTATTEIRLDCGKGVELGKTPDTATEFWFVIPPVEFEKGFNISVASNSGGVMKKSTSRKRNITRNVISPMEPIKAVFEPVNIRFVDTQAKSICLDKWDTDKDGELSYAEAAAVEEIGDVFHFTWIRSFDELRFFTGLHGIGESAFGYCHLLESVVIPGSVDTIGFGAFVQCDSLKSVTILPGVSGLDRYSFAACWTLNHIDLPESVSYIGEGAFIYCFALQSIRIPDRVKIISKQLFSECEHLVTVELPDSLITIGERAFECCYELMEINLPDRVDTISQNAFYGCEKLTSIDIPESTRYIHPRAFSGCLGLRSISVDNNNQTYDSRDGCNAIIEKDTDRLIIGCKESSVIPQSVKIIGQDAFYGVHIDSISLPDGLVSIESNAFLSSSLSQITIPSSVVEIHQSAFQYCSCLSEINVKALSPPSGGNGMFAGTNCPIYVPEESLSEYKTAPYWNKYADRIMPKQFE